MTGISSINLRPIAAVIAIVSLNQKLLLVRRANAPDAGYWGFPGGKIGFRETISDAAVRELREETGVIAEAEGVLTALDAFDRTGELFARNIFWWQCNAATLAAKPSRLTMHWPPVGSPGPKFATAPCNSAATSNESPGPHCEQARIPRKLHRDRTSPPQSLVTYYVLSLP